MVKETERWKSYILYGNNKYGARHKGTQNKSSFLFSTDKKEACFSAVSKKI